MDREVKTGQGCLGPVDQTSARHTRRRALRSALLAIGASALLLGCATAPRGPAATLADAGVAATNAFATDVRDTAARVQEIDTLDTFAATYGICSVSRIACAPQLKSDANYQARQQLVAAIKLRAAAIDGLGRAYSTLKAEATYDARADVVDATNHAIDGVNSYYGAVAALAPPAALISAPLQRVVGLGAGLLADRAQRKRLVHGSHKIAEVTARFHEALEREAAVFDGLAAYIEQNRTAAKLAYLDSGLGSQQEIVEALGAQLQMKPVNAVDPVIAASPAARAAVRSVVEVQSRAEVERARARYHAALGALDALLASHHDLEQERAVSTADVLRFVAELDAALTPVKGEK